MLLPMPAPSTPRKASAARRCEGIISAKRTACWTVCGLHVDADRARACGRGGEKTTFTVIAGVVSSLQPDIPRANGDHSHPWRPPNSASSHDTARAQAPRSVHPSSVLPAAPATEAVDTRRRGATCSAISSKLCFQVLSAMPATPRRSPQQDARKIRLNLFAALFVSPMLPTPFFPYSTSLPQSPGQTLSRHTEQQQAD